MNTALTGYTRYGLARGYLNVNAAILDQVRPAMYGVHCTRIVTAVDTLPIPYYSSLQHTPTYSNILQPYSNILQHTPTYSNILQHTPTILQPYSNHTTQYYTIIYHTIPLQHHTLPYYLVL